MLKKGWSDGGEDDDGNSNNKHNREPVWQCRHSDVGVQPSLWNLEHAATALRPPHKPPLIRRVLQAHFGVKRMECGLDNDEMYMYMMYTYRGRKNLT